MQRHLHRDWQGSADGRQNIRRTPHPRELEGDEIRQDADDGCGGEYCNLKHAFFRPIIVHSLYSLGRQLV